MLASHCEGFRSYAGTCPVLRKYVYEREEKDRNSITCIRSNTKSQKTTKFSSQDPTQLLLYTPPHVIIYLRTMAEICPTCGLPKDICVCSEISKEQQRVRVRLETRKWGRAVTIIDGINDKETDMGRLAQKMKTYCACGGTAKNGQILLQGDHRDKVHNFLLNEMGYPEENIEVT